MIILNILFAVLTYWLAARKHREPLNWGIAGGLVPIFTLLGLAFFCDLGRVEDEDAARKSLKREKIFLAIMIIFGLLNIFLIYIEPKL